MTASWLCRTLKISSARYGRLHLPFRVGKPLITGLVSSLPILRACFPQSNSTSCKSTFPVPGTTSAIFPPRHPRSGAITKTSKPITPMKLDPTFPIQDCREFKPWSRSRRAAGHSPPQYPARTKFISSGKPDLFARLRRHRGQVVASFGTADLLRHNDGRWELRGGTPADHAAAREWSSLFQHEATFPSAPLPVTVPPPKTSNAAAHRILIADDDTMVRASLAAVLESEGYLVDEAPNGMKAVACAIERRPDLVLLDLNMPLWDGWTAFRQLDRVSPLLPVIVITARPHQYEKAVQLGVDAFMEKPLDFTILLHAIKRLTSEDEDRHLRRITNRGFVTKLLGSLDS